MGCYIRERKGFCGHNQCPFPLQSGFECVDITHGVCEVAGSCNVDCKYNMRDKDIVHAHEAQPFSGAFPLDWLGSYRTFEDALNNHDPFVHVNGAVHKPFYMRTANEQWYRASVIGTVPFPEPDRAPYNFPRRSQ